MRTALILLTLCFFIGFTLAGVAHSSPPPRRAYPVLREVRRASGWVCAQPFHGVPFRPGRDNILRGICVRLEP